MSDADKLILLRLIIYILPVIAAAKVLTVVIEVAGVGVRSGWNAGGWAAGSSGYATVAWFGLVLLALS